MNPATWSLDGWHRFWAIWFGVSVGVFLAAELFGLVTDHRRMLSYAIWALENLKRGQAVWAWSFGHYAFTGGFILLALWLIGHFGWGLWR